MSGHHAYQNYCAAYNYCEPVKLPRFTSIEYYEKHAKVVSGEQYFIKDKVEFNKWFGRCLDMRLRSNVFQFNLIIRREKWIFQYVSEKNGITHCKFSRRNLLYV